MVEHHNALIFVTAQSILEFEARERKKRAQVGAVKLGRVAQY